MNEIPSTVLIGVVTAELDIGASFIGDLCGTPGLSGSADVDGDHVRVELMDLEGPAARDIDSRANEADGFILLAHFLDSLSLDRLKMQHQRLLVRHLREFAVALYWKSGESDYKISCPSCDKRVLVRLADEGRVGRCPHCGELLRLILPDILLQNVLQLPKSAYIHTVVGSSTVSAHSVLKDIVHHVLKRRHVSKTQTLRIEFDPAA